MSNQMNADDVVAAFGATDVEMETSKADRMSDVAVAIRAAKKSREGQELLELRRSGDIDREAYRIKLSEIIRSMSES